MEKKKLSVVTPFYNEENEILNLLKNFEKFEKKNKVVKEYIFINDCSTDSSLSIIKNYIKKKKINKKIKIFNNKKNIGWCKSVLKGYKIANAENIIFIPGDGEIRLTDCYKNIKLENKEIILIQRKTMSDRPYARIIISYLYRYMISKIFKIKLLDYNSVIILKKRLIKILKIKSNSFFISAEILIKAIYLKIKIDDTKKLILFKKNNYKSTSLSIKSVLAVTKDFFKTLYFIYLKS
jgi:glycosyltransferase involved in cell wall biosynthesis